MVQTYFFFFLKGTDKFFFQKDPEPNWSKKQIMKNDNVIATDSVKSLEKMDIQR